MLKLNFLILYKETYVIFIKGSVKVIGTKTMFDVWMCAYMRCTRLPIYIWVILLKTGPKRVPLSR